MYKVIYSNNTLQHHGIIGQKWGVRRFQNKDGSLTGAGRKRYDDGESNTPSNKSTKIHGSKNSFGKRFSENINKQFSKETVVKKIKALSVMSLVAGAAFSLTGEKNVKSFLATSAFTFGATASLLPLDSAVTAALDAAFKN